MCTDVPGFDLSYSHFSLFVIDRLRILCSALSLILMRQSVRSMVRLYVSGPTLLMARALASSPQRENQDIQEVSTI